MGDARVNLRSLSGTGAALLLSLSAVAACAERAPEDRPIAQAMPGADVAAPSVATGSIDPAEPADRTGTDAGVPAQTTPGATGTADSGAVNPTPAGSTGLPTPEGAP
jgi:hypothetical protein